MAWNTGTSFVAGSAWGATQANGVGLDLRTVGGNVDYAGYNLSNLGVLSFHASGYVSGNVGLGVVPTDKLTFAELAYVPSENGPCIRWQSTGGALIYRMGARINASGVGRIAIDGYSGSGTYAERLCINDSGNVGIGTESPSGPLHVSNASDPTIILQDSDVNASGEHWYFRNNAGRFIVGQTTSADGSWSAWAERMVFTSGGNVGIGKTPGSKFAVSGLPTYADNTAAIAGGLTAGDCYRTAAGVVMVTY